MEYRHMKFFVAVAEELNFTRAASLLRVAQPHLSREIRSLERDLEVPLFVRDKRQVALTSAGKAFLEHTYRILAMTSEAVRAAQRAHRGESGRVRVGFSSSAGFGVLPDAVRRFRQERADVELILAEYNSDEQPDLLRGFTVDACLLYPPGRPEHDLKTETLAIDPLVVALPSDHPLANQQSIDLATLSDEPWIFFRRHLASCLHDEILRACAQHGFSPIVMQEARKLSTITSLVASGLGVALVPVTLTRLRLPGMVFRPVSGTPPTVPLSLMWRDGDQNPAVMAFLDTVRAESAVFQPTIYPAQD